MSEVIYYSSDETGAPSLNNAAGSLIAVLDACLINGYNSKSVTSIVVASSVATMVISAHGYLTNRKLLLAGAVTSAINGVKKITVVDANTVTFAAPGVADGAISGTITAKRAPLGWTKLFTATNQAIYQRTDPSATVSLLRVDDTVGNAFANVLMCETATAISTYTNNTGALEWAKGANSSSPQNWILVGDGSAIHFFADMSTSAGAAGMAAFTFGDIVSYRAADAYCCMIGGSIVDPSIMLWNRNDNWSVPNAALIMQRSVSQFGVPVAVSAIGSPTNSNSTVFGGVTGASYPSVADGGMVFQDKVPIYDGQCVRGYVRGLKEAMAVVPTYLHKAEMTGIHGTSATYLVVSVKTGSQGGVGLDLTGPWS